MTRKLSSLLVLTLLLVSVLAVNSFASRMDDLSNDKVKSYGFSKLQATESFNSSSARVGTTSSLGTFGADGGSPGYIVGRSFQDRQNWYNPGRTVDWRGAANIHFVFTFAPFGGDDMTQSANFPEYTMFDATTGPNGVWVAPIMWHTDPFNYTVHMPQMDVDETGHMIGAYYTSTPNTEDDPNNCEMYWDVAGPGAFGTFLGDTLNQSLSQDPTVTVGYPKIEYQEYGGQYITHIVAVEFAGPFCSHWRRVGGNPTMGGWEYNLISDNMNWSGENTIAASRVDGKVAVVWMQNEGGADEDNVVFVESTDGGATWPAMGSETSIINIDNSEGASNWLPWCEVNALYDTDGYLHIAYNAEEVIDGTAQGIDPARLFHWTNRVAGANAGGKLVTVAIADFHGLAPMCGRAGTNVLNLAKGMMSQCNDKLYMIWQQFGDPDAGDSLDCPTDGDWTGGYNSDIYVSVSSTLDGSLWDKGRNLTNSKTPECDSTVANNCDHDNYASPSRYGMNTASMGSTYWTAVPEAFAVRDIVAPGYADDGWYIDVQYVNDLYPDNASFGDNAFWTYNPIKWFRLPCMDPIIKPAILCSHEDFLAPTDWVKVGQPVVIEDVTIENIGNEALNVTGVTSTVTVGQASWVSIASAVGTIQPGEMDYFDVTINPAGIVTTQEALEATINITSNDPDRPSIQAFRIATVIADTVVQVVWDTVSTSAQFALTVANQGNAGRSGWGNVNLDFVYMDSTGPECTITSDTDASEHVYLYDLCPVIMYDGSGAAGTYSWGPFWTPGRAAANNFFPVSDDIQAKEGQGMDDGDGFAQYRTNTFVTSDSALGCVKTWAMPLGATVNYAIEKWEIYSRDGGTHTDVAFGEWIDWDVPTGTAGNEGSFVANPGHVDFVYQQGKNELAPETAPCIDDDVRLGGSGLLGHYYASEKAADDAVNHTGLYGGFVALDGDLFADGADGTFLIDSAWAHLNRNSLEANNDEDADQQIWLSYGLFDITPGDTLVIWTVHATVYNGDESTLQAQMDAAEAWYLANRNEVGKFGCCGLYTDPAGYTGNTNCSEDGKITLSDITALIDHVYISKLPLCCQEAGNTNGSTDGKVTLSDITRLIDRVYISKGLTEPCM